MKLILNKNLLNMYPEQFMREAGYAYLQNRNGGQDSFMRRLGYSSDYPRYHIYLNYEGENVIINLHLDQKKPSYLGSLAHNGEYDGELVSGEIERLKMLLNKNSNISNQSNFNQSSNSVSQTSIENPIGHGNWQKVPAKPQIKKTFWQKIFG